MGCANLPINFFVSIPDWPWGSESLLDGRLTMRFWNKFCKRWVCIKDAMLLCSCPATCIADGLKAGVVVSQEELCTVLCSVYWVGWRSTLLYDCPWLFWLSFHAWFIRWYLAQRVGRALGKLYYQVGLEQALLFALRVRGLDLCQAFIWPSCTTLQGSA